MADFYIATTGDDATGDGSIGNPFLTWGRVDGEMNPGDTLYMRGGTYNFRHSFTRDGTALARITITPFPGETVIFDGTGQPLTFSQSMGFVNGDYVDVVGDGRFILRNSSGRGFSFFESQHSTVSGIIVHDIDYRGIGGSGHYITIENCELYNSALVNFNYALGTGGWPGGIQSTRWGDGTPSDNWIIRNNYVHEVWGEGILPSSMTGGLVENNHVVNTASILIYLEKFVSGVCRNNLCEFDNPAFIRPDRTFPAHGIVWATEADDAPFTPGDIDIYNNILVGCGSGIRFYFDLPNTAIRNTYYGVRCYHNYIFDNYRESLSVDDVPPGNDQPFGCEFYNNICTRGSQNNGDATVGDIGAWTIDYNMWSDAVPGIDGVNSFVGAPLISRMGNDFSISNLSPALAAGTNVGVVSDYNGEVRPNPPAIGPLEEEVPVGPCVMTEKPIQVGTGVTSVKPIGIYRPGDPPPPLNTLKTNVCQE